MDNIQPIIKLQEICFSYTTGAPVLNKLDFSLYKGDRLGLLAPNGSGKTTLFHIIMGLLTIDSGRIDIFDHLMENEKDFAEIRPKVGLLFQDADDQLFCPTVMEDVTFGPLNMGKSKEEAIALSKRILSSLGLSDFEQRLTFKLSGGEKKLVSFATVLAMEPEVLLLDEPLSGLDSETRLKLTDYLLKTDLSYMVISHDIEFLKTVTTKIFTMRGGKMYVDDKVYVHHHDHAHVLGNVPHQH